VCAFVHNVLFWSATPCASPPPWPSIFSDYSFWVHHLVNRDDRQLLAHAMASDFSVPWQCLSKRTIGMHNVLSTFVFGKQERKKLIVGTKVKTLRHVFAPTCLFFSRGGIQSCRINRLILWMMMLMSFWCIKSCFSFSVEVGRA
jgi:hypothetical protein